MIAPHFIRLGKDRVINLALVTDILVEPGVIKVWCIGDKEDEARECHKDTSPEAFSTLTTIVTTTSQVTP